MSYSPPGLLSAAEIESREFIQKVYAWMSVGLAVTGGCALYMASDPRMIMALVQNKLLFYGLLIAQLGLVIGLSGWINNMEVGTARFVFLFYAALTGVTMSVIFLIYTNASIASTFFITGGVFGAMSLYGYTTKTDLTSIGPPKVAPSNSPTTRTQTKRDRRNPVNMELFRRKQPLAISP